MNVYYCNFCNNIFEMEENIIRDGPTFSSSELCAKILKYLENINTIQSFPINKNQISIHLEEAGIVKKRTGEGNKFESTEPQPDDITFIINDVVTKIKK